MSIYMHICSTFSSSPFLWGSHFPWKVSMGTGETLVELTNCDLVLSGAGITFYSAFVYVAWRKIVWMVETHVNKGEER